MEGQNPSWYKASKYAEQAHLVTACGSAFMVTKCGVAIRKTSAVEATDATRRCWECRQKEEGQP